MMLNDRTTIEFELAQMRRALRAAFAAEQHKDSHLANHLGELAANCLGFVVMQHPQPVKVKPPCRCERYHFPHRRSRGCFMWEPK
jgi:hypothetical protein